MFTIFQETLGHNSIHLKDVLSQLERRVYCDDGHQPPAAYPPENTPTKQIGDERPWALGFVKAGWQAG
jgi:hypothetical protein